MHVRKQCEISTSESWVTLPGYPNIHKKNILLLSHQSAKPMEDPEWLDYIKAFKFVGPRMTDGILKY